MDNLQSHKRGLQLVAFAALVIVGATTAAALYYGQQILKDYSVALYAGLGVFIMAISATAAGILTSYAIEPLDFIWRAVIHVSSDNSNQPPPNLDDSKVAHELVSSLVLRIYQLASTATKVEGVHDDHQLAANNLMTGITNNFPLPLFAVNNKQTVIFCNEAALIYLGLERDKVINSNVYSILDLAFSDNDTYDAWLQECRVSKARSNRDWERVRLTLADQKTVKQFDMAASYTKDNPSGVESILTIFDQTERYLADDRSLDFMALAVHELRTPLTVLRGYIEVFEDEISDSLDPEYQGLLHQLHASAAQLTAFVNNILNVARIQEGTLALQLSEENWGEVIKGAVNDLAMQAQVYNKVIDFTVEGNVPSVAVDKISIVEVINNLADNALKYSGKSPKVSIHAYVGQDGMIETTVQDWGVGIPSSVMPHLFEKFQRNYRNQAQIGGTGLGLYLSSQLVEAMGGHIWVKSKVDEGTTIGFTLQPYHQLAESLKNSNNKDIVRTAHGWIKNHSLYRK